MRQSEKFWDRLANQWDAAGNELSESEIMVIDKTIKHLNPNYIALDYGCGTGTITNQLSDQVKEIHGIDISAKMIDVAARIAKEQGIENVSFSQATIFDEELQPETFDVILAFDILHLVEDAAAAVERIHQLTKPGGVFISTTPCLAERGKSLGVALSLLGKLRLVPEIRKFSRAVLAGILQNAGFEISDSEAIEESPTNLFILAKKR